MKIAIFESIITPGGHEVDFDRMLVEELNHLGHAVSFMIPQNFTFKYNYDVPVLRLPGDTASYTGIKGLKKIWVSSKKTINRQRWYNAIYKEITNCNIDAVIVPTSTYRYLRALNINKLKHSPKPVIFIFHGITPKDASNFLAQIEKFKSYPNIKAAVITFGNDVFDCTSPNITCIVPPTYLPRDLGELPITPLNKNLPLKLGFLGQYRREKKLEDFLDTFIKGNYLRKIKLIVQGSTMNPLDAADFDRIIKKYSQYDYIEFLHKGLIGIEWQKKIASVDALLMPYSAARYRYQPSAMLFTAIGYKKPVIMSDEINPEVTEKYRVGMTYKSGDLTSLQKTIETFINTYDENAAVYAAELDKAYKEYHPTLFAQKLADLVLKNNAT